MKFFCDQCNAQYMIADEKVGPKGVKVKCKKCSNLITVKPLLQGDATTIDRRPEPDKEVAAASRKTETGEISGAFDSLFSGGSDDKGAAAWGNQATTAMHAPAAGAAAVGGEKEWYVAIDDAQVGPIDMAEMTQRWDAKEISEDSLAWKGGMPDWVAISDIPDLAHLIKDRPQKKVAGTASTAGAAAGTTAGQAAAAKSAAAIEWKPSAASALSSLVQEELIAAKAPKEDAKRPDGVPDLGSGYASKDLFGGNVGGGTQPEGFGSHSDANWSVPAARPTRESEGGIKAVHIFGGLGAVVVLGMLGMMFMMLMKQNQAPPPSAPQAMNTPPPAAQPHPTAAPPPPTTAPTAPAATPPPAAATPTPAGEKAGGDDEDDEKSGRHGKGKHKAKEQRGGGGGREPSGPAAAPPPAAPPAAAAKASLSKEDIWGVVRSNASRVGPCLKAARAKGEIQPSSYTFILNWTIRPDGGVQGAQLTGPPQVLGSSLPGCFASVLGTWHFPASVGGAPIKNFPFGPVNVP